MSDDKSVESYDPSLEVAVLRLENCAALIAAAILTTQIRNLSPTEAETFLDEVSELRARLDGLLEP